MHGAVYDLLMRPMERGGLRDRRRRLLALARGNVLEIGAGTGRNLEHYRGIDHLTVVEPDAGMRRSLLDRMANVDYPVTVHDAGLEDAGLEPASFDTIVSTLVFCSIPDMEDAVATLRATLKPDGQLLFLEHVVGTGVRARLQRAVRPAWSRLFGGCQPDRDPVGALRAGGLFVSDCERFRLRNAMPVVSPAVQGVAVIPKAAA